MDRLQYTVDLEPTDETYVELIRTSVTWCSRALLVVQDGHAMSNRGDAVLRRLEPDLIRREVRASWPGTTLLEGSATVATYQLTSEVVAALTTAATGLYDWQQPELPEDLCLLRDEDDPWLVSIAHEGDAFVSVDEDELEELRRRVPRFAAVLVPEDSPQL